MMDEWKMKNRFEVAKAIENKGLEYFVTGYSQSSQMPDDELKEIFQRAEEAYFNFQEICEELSQAVGIET